MLNAENYTRIGKRIQNQGNSKSIKIQLEMRTWIENSLDQSKVGLGSNNI